jgi:hypothetical protein
MGENDLRSQGAILGGAAKSTVNSDYGQSGAFTAAGQYAQLGGGPHNAERQSRIYADHEARLAQQKMQMQAQVPQQEPKVFELLIGAVQRLNETAIELLLTERGQNDEVMAMLGRLYPDHPGGRPPSAEKQPGVAATGGLSALDELKREMERLAAVFGHIREEQNVGAQLVLGLRKIA